MFLAASLVLFFLLLSVADSVGLVPSYIDETPPAITSHSDYQIVALSALPELGSESTTTIGVLPQRLVIPAIDLDLPIQNPETRNIKILDDLLKHGPARYVDSAKLGEKGNVLIFAHSSHLPIVHNQMYRAFNRIPELKAGDAISIKAEGVTYRYSVINIRRADANEEVINLSPSIGERVTLVTCDTLTGKSARYILEADFVAQI